MQPVIQRRRRGSRSSVRSALSFGSSGFDATTLLLPYIDISAKYETAQNPESLPSLPEISAVKTNRHGTLHAKLAIQSLPDEMVIKPSFVDFLEGVLISPELIPPTSLSPVSPEPQSTDKEQAREQEEDENKTGRSSPVSAVSVPLSTGTSSSAQNSLPVDVILAIHIKPSPIRFSCLPQTLECTVNLPSVDIALSSLSSKAAGNGPSQVNQPNGNSLSLPGGNGVFLTVTMSKCSLVFGTAFNETLESLQMGNRRKEAPVWHCIEIDAIQLSLARQRVLAVGAVSPASVFITCKSTRSVYKYVYPALLTLLACYGQCGIL